MADKKPLNKQIPSSMTYPNPYAEGEFFSPSNVQLNIENIRKNIPLGLGNTQFNQSSAIPPQPMPQTNVIRNAGLQMIPQEPKPEDDTNFLGSLIAQGVTGLGIGLMGGSPWDIQHSANTFQSMRDKQTNERKAKLYTDPNSEESKKRRLVYSKALGIEIPSEFSYTDLNDPTVLQSIRDKSAQVKLASIPKQSGVSGAGKPKEEKQIKIEQKDIDEMGRVNELRNLTNDLNQSIKQYGNKWFGGEAKNQDTLKYNIAATMGVLKDQGAMTESDINFWTKSLEKATSESPDDYSNRLNNLQKNLINKQINKLENKGYHVETKGNKYFVYTKDGLDPIAEF